MHDVLGNIQSKPLPIVSKEVQDEVPRPPPPLRKAERKVARMVEGR